MACASASELNRRVATGLANASLLPELQNLRTSMHPFEYLLRLGSNGLLFSGSGDRKSTRLNSSHGYISYADFCLKKTYREATRSTPVSPLLATHSTQYLH